MFRNYLTTALRNLAGHKLYSFINIAGLAVGLACAILILLYVREELSYDVWIPGSENIYRVEVTYHLPARADLVTAQTSMPLPLAMREQIPEVRAATRLASERMTMIAGDRRFLVVAGVVDPNFLQVIRLPLVSGNAGSILAQPEIRCHFANDGAQVFRGRGPGRKNHIHGKKALCTLCAILR